ncbi:MAG: hypothetical protein IH848_04070 [Acidobacteria bacterium]|nr:hypothetical protein [Acidobacteriota bacterium]
MTRAAVRTVLRVDFGPERPQRRDVAPTGRVPRVTRLLALAHRIDGMIRSGELDDLADAARRLNLTRARVTQITNLLLLAPEIQDAILGLPLVTNGADSITERQLRPVVAEPDWNNQIKMWREIHD